VTQPEVGRRSIFFFHIAQSGEEGVRITNVVTIEVREKTKKKKKRPPFAQAQKKNPTLTTLHIKKVPTGQSKRKVQCFMGKP